MRKLLITITILSTLAGVYFFTIGIMKYFHNPEYNLEDLSYLGQFVSGFAVAFFTLATILLITLAYINQREEINHLQGMNSQQEILIKAQLNKDRYEKFERTFYRLLDWHDQFRNSISYVISDSVGNKRTWAGRGALNLVLNDFIEDIKENRNKSSREALNVSFENMFRSQHNDMEPYFNNIHSVIEFVDSNFQTGNIDAKEADKFMTIIYGQLSISEKELLYYYGLYNKAPKNLKEILERNGIIKEMDKKNIPQEYKTKYKKKLN